MSNANNNPYPSRRYVMYHCHGCRCIFRVTMAPNCNTAYWHIGMFCPHTLYTTYGMHIQIRHISDLNNCYVVLYVQPMCSTKQTFTHSLICSHIIHTLFAYVFYTRFNAKHSALASNYHLSAENADIGFCFSP